MASVALARMAPAQAQTPENGPTEAATAAPAPPAPQTEPESADTRAARELTLRARERFDAGDYDAALAEFTRAYDVLKEARRRAALLNNIAVCHERLFHYDLALQYYERYLHEADAEPADRAEVEAIIRGLRGLLGKLHITSNVRAQIWIDDRALGWAPGDVEVPAGTRVVKLEASGRQVLQREINIVARTTQTAHFELEALPEYHGIKPTYFWTGVGLTAVAAVTGMGLGLKALSVHHENQKLSRAGLLTVDLENKKRNLAIAADVSFGVAALFAVGTTVLIFLTDFRGANSDKPSEKRSSSFLLAPSFARGTAQLHFARVFP